jgi:hypothetical protein
MKNYLGLLSVLFTLISGCASLDKINDFAGAAQKGAAGFETLPVTFKSLCADDCKEQDIKAGKLNSAKCDCIDEGKADSVDNLLYKTVARYLDGLEKLSSGKTAAYNFDSLSTQLTALNVPAATVTAYSKLGSVITTAITNRYRKNKTGIYVREANPPLQVILHYLRDNVGTGLAVKLNVGKSKLESDYFDLLKSSGNDFEKREIIEAYYARKAVLQKQLDELRAYDLVLKNIAEGHQKLFEEEVSKK